MRISSALFLLLIPIFLFAGESVKIHCYKVVDGDTIYGVTEDGDTLKVRLWGIDCPERDQPYGDSATQFVRGLCEGRTVSLKKIDKDRYGRIVGNVLFYGSNTKEVEIDVKPSLAITILNHGYGWWSEKYAPDEYEYKNAEKRARAENVGLWSDRGAVAPWEWRKLSKKERDIRRRIFKRGIRPMIEPITDSE